MIGVGVGVVPMPRRRVVATDVPQSEADALVDLYLRTDGANWTTNTNWLATGTVADWYGITVSGGHVTVVELAANNMVGAINWPRLMVGLPALTKLDLNENPDVSGDMSGMIMPDTLENLWLGFGDLGVSNSGCNPTISGEFTVSAAMQIAEFGKCPITDDELGIILSSFANGIGSYTYESPSLNVFVDGLYAADHETAYNALIAAGWWIGTYVRE